MKKEWLIGAMITVSFVVALAGIGYLYIFTPFFGYDMRLSPTDVSGGIQFSPSEGCTEICEDGVFMGCERSFEDLVCGTSCRGVIGIGTRQGEMPKIGSTLCTFTECVCN